MMNDACRNLGTSELLSEHNVKFYIPTACGVNKNVLVRKPGKTFV